MKYDDVSWHYQGTFPPNLPHTAAATHIGMFTAWMLINHFGSNAFTEEFAVEITELRNRKITGAELVINVLGEKLTSDELSYSGNAFAIAYYQGQDGNTLYANDYLMAFQIKMEDFYYVEDTWFNYKKIAAFITNRYAKWKAAGEPEYIL